MSAVERVPGEHGASARPWIVPPPRTTMRPSATPPTIAVIIAAYQSAEFIGAALTSVLEQTCRPTEIVVCDDGSTDDLLAALEPFRDEIILVRKEHGGVASAHNAAIRAASSDYVAILDADDLYHPERVEALVEMTTARPDLDIVTTDATLEVDGAVLATHAQYHNIPDTAEGQRAEIISHDFFVCPAVRRQRLLEIGGFDEALRVGEDWDCWIRLILTGSLVGFVNQPLYRYRLRPGSLSSDQARNSRVNVQILSKLLESGLLTADEETSVQETIEIHARRASLLEAKYALLHGEPDARRRALAIAVGHGYSVGTRTKAGFSALAPRTVGRMLRWRVRRSPSKGIELEHR